VCVLLITSFPVPAQIDPRMIICSKISSDDDRLSCYDRLVQELSASDESSAKTEKKIIYIQPPQEFLDSQLRVNPQKSDFDLTINQFIELVKSAKLENGKPVVIKGWSTRGKDYVLHIQMKTPIQVQFVFDPELHSEYSVLQPVLVKGIKMDPALFVMNMAARTM